jgi:23S rRNA (guanosine2251-2'-O)-methyltransferase
MKEKGKKKNFRDQRFEKKEQPGRSPERPARIERRHRPADPSIIFGLLPVLEALRANPRRLEKIFIAEGAREHRLAEIIEIARQNNIPRSFVSRDTISKLVDAGVNTQGIVAFAAAADYAHVDEILDNADESALFVVLDGVEDPRNLGAVLRSAECAGVDGVFIPERRAVGLTDTVAKSSAGATEYVKVGKVGNINRLIEELKSRDIWVIGTSGDADTSYTDWDWTRPSALVLGGEGSGLHRLVAENCDVLVKIPMYGKIESLNVSVAAGVILFEALRQRNQ